MRRLLPLLAVVLALIAFGSALPYDYVWDAQTLIPGNRLIEQGRWARILTSDYWAGSGLDDDLYRPWTIGSFALERALAGASRPALSRAVNLALHLLVAGLFGCLLRRWRVPAGPAVALAAVLLLHPLLAQSVVNVIGRAELLVACGALGALLCFGFENERRAAWGAAACLGLALGAKETGLAVFGLVLIHGWRAVPDGWRVAGRIAPSAIPLALWLCGRTLAIEAFPGGQQPLPFDNVLSGLDGLPRVATTLAMAGRYLRLFLWPEPLAADYSGAAIAVESFPFAPLPLLGLALLGGSGLLVAAGLLRRGGPALEAAALFLFPYAVVGNLLVLNGAGFAERLFYVPALGLLALLALALARLAPREAAGAKRYAAGALVVLLLVGGTLQIRRRAPMWSSNESLLTATLDANPGSLRAHFALAEMRARQGRSKEALRLYERATEIDPEHGPSWLERGRLLAAAGSFAEAERCVRRALEIRPDIGDTRMVLGQLLARRGALEPAARSLRHALALQPGLLKAAVELAHVRFRQARYAEAAALYRRCIERGRDDLRANLREAERRAEGA